MPKLNKKDIAAEISKVHRKLLSDLEFSTDKSLEDKRQIRVIAASGKADRTGDIVNVEGIELGNFKKNPIILWGHDHYGLPVAKAVEAGVVDGKLQMVLEFATKEIYEFADTVYKLVKGGFLKGVSIGARVLDAEWMFDDDDNIIGRKFNKLELLELSIVAIPADSKALITAVKSGAISCTDMELCLEKSFEASLDSTNDFSVESTTDSSSTEEIDMEKLAALEKRIAELEAQLAKANASGEQSQKLASSIESVLGTLLAKMNPGKTEDRTSAVGAAEGAAGVDIMKSVTALLETMTNKVSVSR